MSPDDRTIWLDRLAALGNMHPARMALADFLRRALAQPLGPGQGSADPAIAMEAAVEALAAPGAFTLNDAVAHRDALLEEGWQGDEPSVTAFMQAVSQLPFRSD